LRAAARSVMGGDQIGHLLIELAEMVLDCSGFFSREPIVSAFQRCPRSDQARFPSHEM
jgi:hypothetical protein